MEDFVARVARDVVWDGLTRYSGQERHGWPGGLLTRRWPNATLGSGLEDLAYRDCVGKILRPMLFWLTPFVYGLAKSVVISSSLIPRLHWWSGNSPRWYSQHSLIGVGSGFSGELYSEYWWCVNQRIPAPRADLDFTSVPDRLCI